ncbi:nucleotidyltransferase domain-containing protein [Methylomonas fluvii]|uniref:Nucleotidyltransferase domain-containing protein n=1 Tax=Methylomonas fluvii TaxID=1854564 RepID=A0ABR9DB90_9GAMM|nr:nucleotidyltransferase domain-containing protein [Methylomonas fluvii]MBD9360378.1 nucleotidyltransferase domain-containing protein [Methylomonas fluvii]
MINSGLTPDQLALLVRVFQQHPQIDCVKLYGSRAKGTFQPRSDVDLVAFGDGIDRFLLADILLDLEDSALPYQVDLQNYHELKNRALIDHIDRVGVVLYQRQKDEEKCS